MTNEIHDINTRALDFVAELIEYIFEYPDDDYMTMECLCRKLHKHGLIDKKDGEWVADTPQTDECEGCKHYVYQLGCTHHATCEYERKEPQTEQR